ncbi:MAG: energy transducer TonB [Bacteroidia bacterium]|nr:energy transducer TonB [Bacteroidia bacterium]
MKTLIYLIILFVCLNSNTLYAQNPNVEADSTEEVLIEAEQMPSFIGGEDSLYSFLRQRLVYPQLAKENGIEGKVIVRFIVEKNGKLTNIEVLRKMGWGCDEEAIRILKLSPNWIPGKMRGKAVRVKYTLPINFRL